MRENNWVCFQGELRDSVRVLAWDGLSVSAEWDQDGEPWTPFEVCPKVCLLNGASEFCGKKDILLLQQKSQNANTFCVTQTSFSFLKKGQGSSAILVMVYESSNHLRLLGVSIMNQMQTLFRGWLSIAQYSEN